jgi:peptide/nickel transport system substrate-binding protein
MVVRRRYLGIVLGVAIVLAQIGAGCTGNPNPKPTVKNRSSLVEAQGGTLRVGVMNTGANNYDPQAAWEDPVQEELARCCLFRTLLSYSGHSTREGGAILRPDIATGLPEVSSDGLIWTIHLRPELRYAPPLQDVEIVAGDFVRSILRELSPATETGLGVGLKGDIAPLIQGAKDYVDGGASTVTGIEAPDTHTLAIHLTRPDPDLGNRLAESAFAPIPANPFDPTATFGVAEGHEGDYGNFLVASGPYMLEGSHGLDFSKPPIEQPRAEGVSASSVTLVRNPSWSRSTDALRGAFVDRIVLSHVESEQGAERAIESGALDLVVDWDPSAETVARFTSQSSFAGRVFVNPQNAMRYADINVAVPPFDDIHVRRAMSLVIDKRAVLAVNDRGGGPPSAVMRHVFLDSEENNLLLNYDPYPTPEDSGDTDLARQEMARSSYDANHDGMCDARICDGVTALAPDEPPWRVEASRVIAKDLRAIGVHLDLHPSSDELFATFGQPYLHWGLRLLLGVTADFPSARFLTGDFTCCDNSMVGATAAQLRKYGYPVSSVPSADSRIEQCRGYLFQAAVQCFAGLDQYLMMEVVARVPLLTALTARIVSERIAQFSFDQPFAFVYPALDQIALKPEARGETPRPSSSAPSPPAGPASLVPNGTYTTTISARDAEQVGLEDYDLDQAIGSYTLTLRDGYFKLAVTGDHVYDRPASVGTYSGSGHRIDITFETLAFKAPDRISLQWSVRGNQLGFRVIGASFPIQFAIVPWAAHPWVKAS